MEPLSPGEQLVLLEPETSKAAEAVKVTMLSLLAQGVLKIEKIVKKRFFMTRANSVVCVVRDLPDGPRHAAALVEVVRSASLAEGAPLKKIVEVARASWDAKFDLFKTGMILPRLIERGLLQEQRKRVSLIFSKHVYVHTPAGEMERARIQSLVLRARQIPELLKTNPAEATAIVLAAGGTLLLVPELRKYYGELADLQASAAYVGGGGGSDSSYSGSNGNDSTDLGKLDADGLDALNFEALSTFDAGFDSSFSDGGGGDGGGGGSGGDGGGGGGG